MYRNDVGKDQSESQLSEKVGEDGRFAQQRKDQTVNRAPEVGSMADVVHVPPGHVPAVQQVQRSEDVPGYRNRDHEDVETHLRLEKDRGEKDGRNGAGGTDGIVAVVVPVLQQVTHRGDGDGADIQDGEEDGSRGCTERGGEVLLYHRSEEIQREHVEDQVSPSAVDKAIGKHPVPLFPVPYLVSIEYPRMDVQRPCKAQDAYPCGNQDDDQRNHALAKIVKSRGFSYLCREYVEGADWLLSEAFCLYEDRERFQPYEKNHSTVLNAARLAEELKVKNLILYHTEDKTLESRRERYTAEAESVFHGRVFVPDDLEWIEL